METAKGEEEGLVIRNQESNLQEIGKTAGKRNGSNIKKPRIIILREMCKTRTGSRRERDKLYPGREWGKKGGNRAE